MKSYFYYPLQQIAATAQRVEYQEYIAEQITEPSQSLPVYFHSQGRSEGQGHIIAIYSSLWELAFFFYFAGLFRYSIEYCEISFICFCLFYRFTFGY